jgi:hypothetical protein
MVKMFNFWKKKKEVINAKGVKKKLVHGEELLLCPRCKFNMKKFKKNDVVLDVCKKCGGMWVDKGEIEKLAVMNNKK